MAKLVFCSTSRQAGYYWKRISAIATLAVVIPLSTACSNTASTESKTSLPSHGVVSHAAIPVTIENNPSSYYVWLSYVAYKQGYYSKNGLDVSLLNSTAGSALDFAALAAGSLDMTPGDLSVAGPYIAKGLGLTAIGGLVSGSWELVAAKGVHLPATYPYSIKALDGKAVGVTALGTPGYRLMVSLAKTDQVTATYEALGAVAADAVSALSNDRVIAAVVPPNLAYYFVHDLHYQLLFNFSSAQDLNEAGGVWKTMSGKIGGYMFASNRWLAKYPEAARKYQLSLDEADVWAHNPANLPTLTKELLAEKALPSFALGIRSQPYVKALLEQLVAYVPQGSASAFRNFWITSGLLNASFPPVSKWFSATIPTTPNQILSTVRRAGEGRLGNLAS